MSKATRLLVPLAAAAVAAASLLPGHAAAAKQGQGSGSAAAAGMSTATAAGTAAVIATRAAHASNPAGPTVSAPATLVAPVGRRVGFTVTVDNPGRTARGTIVFALVGQLPEPPSPVEATLERRSHSRWVPLREEGAAGTRYFSTGTVKFQHGRTVFRFRIGHPADANPNRIQMRTYALVAGTATPDAHTTVEVPALNP
jgi:hypothetical protein